MSLITLKRKQPLSDHQYTYSWKTWDTTWLKPYLGLAKRHFYPQGVFWGIFLQKMSTVSLWMDNNLIRSVSILGYGEQILSMICLRGFISENNCYKWVRDTKRRIFKQLRKVNYWCKYKHKMIVNLKTNKFHPIQKWTFITFLNHLFCSGL